MNDATDELDQIEGADPATMDLTTLSGHWEKLDWYYRTAVVPVIENRDTTALTARNFDEAQPAGHRGYINAHGQILSGLEHTQALRTLMAEYVTPRAPWTLLRSVYEAGFWATWLLEPMDGKTRRRRGLRAEVWGYKQRRAFYEEFHKYDPATLAESTKDHPVHLATYRGEADALGVQWAELSNKINVVVELGQLEVVQAMEPDMRAATVAVWRSLSGMQHGLAYALMINSDVDQTTFRPLPGGGHEARVTIKDDAFIGSAAAANMLLLEAMKLYVTRTTGS